jgi:multiple antibiotic resistance protein
VRGPPAAEEGIPAETLVLIFIALVAVFSPAAAVAAHSTVVGAYAAPERRRIAIRLGIVVAAVLVVVTWVGQALLDALGLSVPALSATGGLALLLAAVPMMRGTPRPAAESGAATADWRTVVIMPLLFPLSVGGSTIALLIAESAMFDKAADLAAISGVCMLFAAIVGLTNFASGPLDARLSDRGQDLLRLLAGIILTALGLSLLVSRLAELALDAGLHEALRS